MFGFMHYKQVPTSFSLGSAAVVLSLVAEHLHP